MYVCIDSIISLHCLLHHNTTQSFVLARRVLSVGEQSSESRHHQSGSGDDERGEPLDSTDGYVASVDESVDRADITAGTADVSVASVEESVVDQVDDDDEQMDSSHEEAESEDEEEDSEEDEGEELSAEDREKYIHLLQTSKYVVLSTSI